MDESTDTAAAVKEAQAAMRATHEQEKTWAAADEYEWCTPNYGAPDQPFHTYNYDAAAEAQYHAKQELDVPDHMAEGDG